MALTIDKIGWEENEGGEERFIIRLCAETESDVPALPAAVVWDRAPVELLVSSPGVDVIDKAREHVKALRAMGVKPKEYDLESPHKRHRLPKSGARATPNE